jgi:multicomponent Na+:H+ antiporter subunit B
MTTVILKTAAKLLVPLSVLVAIFIYFKGHQVPGGGFVGGLVMAVALIVERMAFGKDSLRKLLPMSYRSFIGIGLLCALGTGLGALMQGLPFLTSNWGLIPLPDGGEFEWASVMVFDLGVMLVVTGVVVGMIDALSEELD